MALAELVHGDGERYCANCSPGQRRREAHLTIDYEYFPAGLVSKVLLQIAHTTSLCRRNVRSHTSDLPDGTFISSHHLGWEGKKEKKRTRKRALALPIGSATGLRDSVQCAVSRFARPTYSSFLCAAGREPIQPGERYLAR